MTMMTARTIEKLTTPREDPSTRPKQRDPLLPGQFEANVRELEEEIQNAGDNIPLKISLISTILTKLPHSKRKPWVHMKTEF
jgi:hypothetical protein